MARSFLVLLLLLLGPGCSTHFQTAYCGPDNCSGHGTCSLGADGQASCTCDVGYVARDQSCVPADCSLVNCGHHGRCVIEDEAARCLCDPGFVSEGLSCRLTALSGTDGGGLDGGDGGGDGRPADPCDDPLFDHDNDGWIDADETACGTDCRDRQSVPSDVDGDQVCDPLDVCVGPDSSGDLDGDGTCNSLDNDDDDDGWTDAQEEECGTDPEQVASVPIDTDDDGTCNSLDDDDDDDGWTDAQEIDCGSDPVQATSVPIDTDLDDTCNGLDEDDDDDGWTDELEEACHSDPLDDASVPADRDGDGDCDFMEDSDGDGWSDGDELACGSNPDLRGSVPSDSDRDRVCDPLDTHENYEEGWDGVLAIDINAHLIALDGDVTNYPLLLRLDSTNFSAIATRVQPRGADLRFAAADGTQLPYEVESWQDGVSGVVWVLVDRVANDAATEILMYYDNPRASSASDGSAVFPVEEEFRGVWHLDENATDEQTTATHFDATSHGNHGRQSGNASTPGIIAQGQWFDGVDDVIDLGWARSLSIADELTMSMWIYMEMPPPEDLWVTLLAKANHLDADEAYYASYIYGTDVGVCACAEYYLSSGETDLCLESGRTDIRRRKWVHVVTALSSREVVIYVNGGVDAIHDVYGTLEPSTGDRLFLGGMIGEFFNGAVDEVRVVGSALSADWVKLDYATQKVGQTLVLF